MAPPPTRRRTLLGLSALGLLCLCPAWSAWHNFKTIGVRSKGAEARTTVRALCEAQRAKPDAGTPVALDPIPDHNRYAYFSAPGVPGQPARSSAERPLTEQDLPPVFAGGLVLGPNGTCPDCSWLVAAVANIDNDPDVDVWSAATRERTAADGQRVAPCEAVHEVDDVAPAF